MVSDLGFSSRPSARKVRSGRRSRPQDELLAEKVKYKSKLDIYLFCRAHEVGTDVVCILLWPCSLCRLTPRTKAIILMTCQVNEFDNFLMMVVLWTTES